MAIRGGTGSVCSYSRVAASIKPNTWRTTKFFRRWTASGAGRRQAGRWSGAGRQFVRSISSFDASRILRDKDEFCFKPAPAVRAGIAIVTHLPPPPDVGADRAMIRMEAVHKWYGEFHALKNIDLGDERGERIVICGPSGSGKSTLFPPKPSSENFKDGEGEIHAPRAPACCLPGSIGASSTLLKELKRRIPVVSINPQSCATAGGGTIRRGLRQLAFSRDVARPILHARWFGAGSPVFQLGR